MLRAIALTLPIVLTACATQAPMSPVSPEQVSVHESVLSAPPRYEVVKRLWVESWRSSFLVPSYASREEAMADFRREAANRGGNGVINFGCYRLPVDGTRLACNGTVVRFL
jgi:hypothetical protein